jgi:hypothetical protein
MPDKIFRLLLWKCRYYLSEVTLSWNIVVMPRHVNMSVDLQLGLGAFHDNDTAEQTWSSYANITFLWANGNQTEMSYVCTEFELCEWHLGISWISVPACNGYYDWAHFRCDAGVNCVKLATRWSHEPTRYWDMGWRRIQASFKSTDVTTAT